MSRTVRILITIAGYVLGGSPAVALASDTPPDYDWPLDAPPGISSNFCEYREGHLHAGVDMRTYGDEGVRCFAAGDGYVSRVRAASSGYGKVVYIQLYSGETLVYAHLSEFAPELEDTVYAAQVQAQRYRVDLRPPRDRFPVRRGDVIGYSGSTGTSAPHLHFEIRSREEHPLDPFLHGFSLDDDLAPVIAAIEIVPLDSTATGPHRFRAVDVGDARYTLCDTIALRGRVGLSVQAYDRLNDVSGKLAPYDIELSVDGVVVSRVAFERFSFAHADQVDLVYDIDRVRREKAYFFRLFRQPGEVLWDREFDADGVLTGRGAGIHEVRVVVRDRAGNAASLAFTIREGAGPGPPACDVPLEPDAGLHFFGAFVRDGDRTLSARALAPAARPLAFGGDTARVFGVRVGAARTVTFDELGFSVDFSRRTLYEDVVAYARPWRGRELEARAYGLIRRSPAVEFGPYALALRADVTLSFEQDAPDSATAVYRLNERKGEWVYYASTITAGAVATTARRPGVYCVFRDVDGPRVGSPSPGLRASYATGARSPEIVIPIEDEGSGLDEDRTEIRVAGRPMIVRWDPNAKKMFVLVRDENIMGTQSISVVAYDRAGNRSVRDATVDIPRAK